MGTRGEGETTEEIHEPRPPCEPRHHLLLHPCPLEGEPGGQELSVPLSQEVLQPFVAGGNSCSAPLRECPPEEAALTEADRRKLPLRCVGLRVQARHARLQDQSPGGTSRGARSGAQAEKLKGRFRSISPPTPPASCVPLTPT